MTYNHIMLDIETLANRPDAAIIQIAAVAFDPHTGETGAEFSRYVCDIAGRHVDAATVAWWLQRAAAPAMGAAMQASRNQLWGDLTDLAQWFGALERVAGVWSHGATYDLPVLQHAFATELHCEPPWGYRTPRDTRTIYALTSGGVPPTFVPVDGAGKHDALADCHTQIRQLCAALAILRVGQFEVDGPARGLCMYSSTCKGHGGFYPTDGLGGHYDCVGPAGQPGPTGATGPVGA